MAGRGGDGHHGAVVEPTLRALKASLDRIDSKMVSISTNLKMILALVEDPRRQGPSPRNGGDIYRADDNNRFPTWRPLNRAPMHRAENHPLRRAEPLRREDPHRRQRKMDSSAAGIVRAKSEQIESAAAIMSLSLTASAEAITIPEINNSSGLSLPAKPPSGGKKLVGTSPGRKGSNHHVRKSRSAQLKLDLEEVSSGAALSRASSASLGLSFSFTGFTAPPEDVIVDLRPSSDEENGVDLEAGVKQKRMILEPTLPIYLKFSELKYKVILKGLTRSTEKDVLNGITGSTNPGEVLALMGPSGSGKTTLLSLLGGRIHGNTVEGLITYNDEHYNKSLKRRIGFVTRDDVLFAHLTVRETLTYSALSGPPIHWKKYYRGWERTQEDLKQEQDAIEEVATRICWKKAIEKQDLSIWQKPINHNECINWREIHKTPHICRNDSADAVLARIQRGFSSLLKSWRIQSIELLAEVEARLDFDDDF